MRHSLIALVLVGAAGFTASACRAQVVVARSVAWGPVVESAPPGYVAPYSYFATPASLPPRFYTGYGPSDFPFHGTAYGRPYDRWTWTYLGSYPAPGLVRYFYPPVP
jgi:hypothetical protein